MVARIHFSTACKTEVQSDVLKIIFILPGSQTHPQAKYQVKSENNGLMTTEIIV